jgi:hypothetical protein
MPLALGNKKLDGIVKRYGHALYSKENLMSTSQK